MTLILSIVLGLLTGFFGHTLRQRTQLSTVAVSSLLTLLAALALPRIFTDGNQYALVSTAVSYVTMSSTERLAKVWETLTVSLFCSVLVYYGQDVLMGIGGRLGTFAALAVLAFTVPRAHRKLFKKGVRT